MKKLIEWIEVPTVDFSRAVKFYNNVFNLNMQELDFGTEKMACFPTGEGAIFYKPNYEPSDKGAIVSFNVPNNIEETCKRIVANGGNIRVAKTKIEAEGRGYFALAIDSEGNSLGLYEN